MVHVCTGGLFTMPKLMKLYLVYTVCRMNWPSTNVKKSKIKCINNNNELLLFFFGKIVPTIVKLVSTTLISMLACRIVGGARAGSTALLRGGGT